MFISIFCFVYKLKPYCHTVILNIFEYKGYFQEMFRYKENNEFRCVIGLLIMLYVTHIRPCLFHKIY